MACRCITSQPLLQSGHGEGGTAPPGGTAERKRTRVGGGGRCELRPGGSPVCGCSAGAQGLDALQGLRHGCGRPSRRCFQQYARRQDWASELRPSPAASSRWCCPIVDPSICNAPQPAAAMRAAPACTPCRSPAPQAAPAAAAAAVKLPRQPSKPATASQSLAAEQPPRASSWQHGDRCTTHGQWLGVACTQRQAHPGAVLP